MAGIDAHTVPGSPASSNWLSFPTNDPHNPCAVGLLHVSTLPVPFGCTAFGIPAQLLMFWVCPPWQLLAQLLCSRLSSRQRGGRVEADAVAAQRGVHLSRSFCLLVPALLPPRRRWRALLEDGGWLWEHAIKAGVAALRSAFTLTGAGGGGRRGSLVTSSTCLAPDWQNSECKSARRSCREAALYFISSIVARVWVVSVLFNTARLH